MKESILKQYDAQNGKYASFGNSVKNHLENVIDPEISIHTITPRVKERDSLSRKIDKKENKYLDLKDITDICGVRIITFLDSDVEKIGKLLEKHFELDLPNCSNKRELEFDRFGYRSLHYVLGFKGEQVSLPGLKQFEGLKLEIQVRSILQHAWAEIEHDLGYKGEIEIPNIIKRGFTRLSALLETADLEFDRLKNQIKNYQESVSNSIIEEPENVSFDKDTLTKFIFTDSILIDVQEMFRDSRKFTLNSSNDDMQFLIVKLRFFAFENIHDIQMDLREFGDHFKRFIARVITFFAEGSLIVSYHTPLVLYMHFRACASSSDFLLAYGEFGSEINEKYRVIVPEYFINMYHETE